MCILVHLFSSEHVTSGGPAAIRLQTILHKSCQIHLLHIFNTLRCKLILRSLYLKCKTENVYFYLSCLQIRFYFSGYSKHYIVWWRFRWIYSFKEMVNALVHCGCYHCNGKTFQLSFSVGNQPINHLQLNLLLLLIDWYFNKITLKS